LSTGKVKTVAFSADRRRLAAGGQDAKVVLWDLETRTSLFAFPGLVERIAFTPGGEILVGGGFDGSIYLWNAATGELLQTLRGHEARVSSIRVRPDGKLLASSSADGTVRLWDLPGRRSTLVLNKANVPMDTAFSPDGSLLAAAAGNTVWVWELSVPAEPDHPIPPSKGLTAARFNPEGSRIASVGEDGLVRQWDSASGELLAAWSGHVSGGRDLCYTPDGKLLASGGFDGVLVIRDAESGAIRHQLSFGDRIWAVACAPDGWHVASGGLDGRVRIWDALSGELVRLFAPPPPLDRINSLIFNPSGRQLVVGRNCGHVEIWDTASEKRVRLLLGHTAQVYGLAVDATGKNARVGWGRSKRASLEPGRRIKPTNR
jgi:WD40 repeat protein